jgi:hypothetical protein
MQVISENISLLWEALFLRPEPYAVMRDEKSPVSKGMIILIVLGLLLALAAFIGSVLTWASSPDPAEIQSAVLNNLQQMSWWRFMAIDPQVEATWFQIWDQVWQIVSIFNPTPASSLAGFIIIPLGLIISWFIFALIANPIAKLFGGQGHFSQTLGTTALAAAPQLLGVLNVLPFVVLAGIGVWTLLARYMAIRVTHGLSWGRSLWVVLLTMLVIILIQFILFGAGIAVAASVMAASFGGG